MQFPAIRLFSIPNGIRTGFKQAIKAKMEGMKSGVPDLYIPKINTYIEMKRKKNSKVSPEQKDWHEYLSEHCNATVLVCYGADDAIKKILPILDHNGIGTPKFTTHYIE